MDLGGINNKLKKLLGILVLGLLCTFSFEKDAHADETWECLLYNRDCSLAYKLKRTVQDLNPLDYFEKRKECQARADRADTVAAGKRRFKYCMDNYPD